MQVELNKIYNEDCYEGIKKIPDKSIDCIYVDIPYLYQSGGKSNNEMGDRIWDLKQQLIKDNIYDGINYSIFEDFIRVSKHINCFIWCSILQVYPILNWFNKHTDTTYNILTWNKTNPAPLGNNSWLNDIEYCLYFREKASGTRLNDGYELKSKFYVSGTNVNDKELYDHPTIKPLDLVKRHILHATKPDDIVLDCFMGSGTTAVACKETGRNFIGFEIDKRYFDIAINRVNGLTQIDKKLKEQGFMNIFDFIDEEV